MIRSIPEHVLDIYFRQCSIRVTCRDLAIMAATLANDGTQPTTGETALSPEFVQDVLTVMHSCGMYDFAGQWSYEIGMAAKSGVSGCVIAAVPGQVGIAAYSPRLDRHGNSVRGIMACRRISADFGLHPFRNRSRVATVLRRELDGTEIRSKRIRPEAERSCLDMHRSSIRIVEAQGALYFATAERLVHRVRALSAEASHMLVDFRHVHKCDRATTRLLSVLAMRPASPPAKILLSGLDSSGPLSHLRAALARDGGTLGLFYDTLDDALEQAENDILAKASSVVADTDEISPLSDMTIFRDLEPDELRRLVDRVDPRLVHFDAGQVIFKEGDPATRFYVIARGSVRVELPVSGVRPRAIRLASIGRTLTFGELAGLDGRPRAAQVVAETGVACYAISFDTLRAFGQIDPATHAKILMNIIRDLADTLRFSNEALRAYEA
jgi:glutaminase